MAGIPVVCKVAAVGIRGQGRVEQVAPQKTGFVWLRSDSGKRINY